MHLTDDELVAHYYGEMSEATERRTVAHLEDCAACRATLARLKRVMATIDLTTMSEPAAGFEQQVWRRLAPALERSRKASRRFWIQTPAWGVSGWGAMAASLVLAAFVAGRMWPVAPEPAPTTAGIVEPVGERVLLVDLGDHLDRTEQALVEFVSRGDAAEGAEAQARTEDLVSSNRLYRGTAEATGDQAVTDVLDDLERVLIEIVGAPANAPAAELEAIRKRIDARDLLFKLRVMRMELAQRASDPRPAKRQGPTT